MKLDELAFRHWLAGLICGEGFFRIHREKQGAYYACHFGIRMRSDEAPLLRAIRDRVDAGHINHRLGGTNGHGITSSPTILWSIESRADCWTLASFLDDIPLFGKKQREYDLWRHALQVWTDMPRGNRWTGRGNYAPMEALWLEMKALRPFDERLAAGPADPFLVDAADVAQGGGDALCL